MPNKKSNFSFNPPPSPHKGKGGRVNLKNKNPGGLVLTYFPSHLADSKFLLLITRGRHRVPVILLSLRFHLVKRKSQQFPVESGNHFEITGVFIFIKKIIPPPHLKIIYPQRAGYEKLAFKECVREK